MTPEPSLIQINMVRLIGKPPMFLQGGAHMITVKRQIHTIQDTKKRGADAPLSFGLNYLSS
jgi:hypothetical protein